jgi:hypothetical protein
LLQKTVSSKYKKAQVTLMDLNTWKILLRIVMIALSIILIALGIYRDILRDRKSIKNSIREAQTFEINKDKGKLKYKFTIGATFIVFGIMLFYLLLNEKVEKADEPVSQEFLFDGWIEDGDDDRRGIGNALVTIRETADTTRSGSDGHFLMRLRKYHESITVLIVANGYAPDTVITKSKGTATFMLKKI